MYAIRSYYEPGGQFLTQPHTLKHCRDNLLPINFCPDARTSWELNERGTLKERATESMHELMKDAAPVQHSPEVLREMDKIVAAADKKLVG